MILLCGGLIGLIGNIMKLIDPAKLRSIAEQYYLSEDYYCSEAVVKTIKDGFGLDISEDAVAMASGFPAGIGGAGCVCGAISGGVMALGMLFGRTMPKDRKVKRLMELSKELHRDFTANHKSSCCRVLTKNMRHGSRTHMQQCASYTGEVTEKIAMMIIRERPDLYGYTEEKNDQDAHGTGSSGFMERLGMFVKSVLMRLYKKGGPMKKIFLAVCVLFMTTGPASAANYVKPEILKEWLSSKKPLIIVDIQPEEDFEEHHLPGSIETNAFPANTDEEKRRLDNAIAMIKKSKADVVIVCPRGKKGAKNAYEYILSRGIPENRLYILEGGIAGWPYPEMFAKGRGR